MNINFICRPVSYFVYALSFPLLPVITALTLTLCTVFITHTNSIYGALHYALLLMITATALRVSLSVQAFAPVHCCPAAGSLRSRRGGVAFLSFLANFPISFVTISIWRSVRRSASLIYQGAPTIFLSTLFWHRWMISVLLGSVHPPSCVPQVHAGFNICLCSVSLLCTDRTDLLHMSQNIFSYFSASSSLFFLTCAFQRSLAHCVMPRYFALFEWGMTLSLAVNCICWHLL